MNIEIVAVDKVNILKTIRKIRKIFHYGFYDPDHILRRIDTTSLTT